MEKLYELTVSYFVRIGTNDKKIIENKKLDKILRHKSTLIHLYASNTNIVNIIIDCIIDWLMRALHFP